MEGEGGNSTFTTYANTLCNCCVVTIGLISITFFRPVFDQLSAAKVNRADSAGAKLISDTVKRMNE